MTTTLAFWPLLVTLVLVVASYLLRLFAPQGNFFHTPPGAIVLSVLTTTLSAATSAIQAHGLDKLAILQAVVGGVLSLIATANPSVATGTTAPMAMKKRPAGIISTRLLYIIATAAAVGVVASFAFAGCATVPAPTSAQWKTAGIDAGKCVVPAVVNAAGDALIALLNSAAGQSVDYKAVGIDVAKKYGPDAAVCAAGKLWLDLGGPDLLKMKGQPTKALVMTDWLVNHQSEWVPTS